MLFNGASNDRRPHLAVLYCGLGCYPLHCVPIAACPASRSSEGCCRGLRVASWDWRARELQLPGDDEQGTVGCAGSYSALLSETHMDWGRPPSCWVCQAGPAFHGFSVRLGGRANARPWPHGHCPWPPVWLRCWSPHEAGGEGWMLGNCLSS